MRRTISVAISLFRRLQLAGICFDLVYYDLHPSFAGHIASEADLQYAFRHNTPAGGRAICNALRETVKRYRKKQGMYIIVITDGEFSDKLEAQRLIVDEFLPHLTPDNPFAFRLHFVGAGAEVDRELDAEFD